MSAVGKMYVTCALMQNAHSILYGSVTSEYFGLNPPTLEEYFIWCIVLKIHLQYSCYTVRHKQFGLLQEFMVKIGDNLSVV